MTKNIEQRTLAAASTMEAAAKSVDEIAHKDADVVTPVGYRKSFPKISREWDEKAGEIKTQWENHSATLRQEWQDERNELSTKSLGVKPWESGVSESNINQQRRWSDNHTYLPKSVPAVMDETGPDDNWIPYTANKSDILNDVFGRKPVDLLVGLKLVPDQNTRYPKVLHGGFLWEIDNGTDQLTVSSYRQLDGNSLEITGTDQSITLATKLAGASEDWAIKEFIRSYNATSGRKLIRLKFHEIDGALLSGHTAIYIEGSSRLDDVVLLFHKPATGTVTGISLELFELTLDNSERIFLSPDSEELCYKQFVYNKHWSEVLDWFPIIKVTHKIANAFNKAVSPSKHIYNIGLLPDEIGAEIETNCDFSECQFRLTKDTAPEEQYGRRRLFSCVSEKLASLEPGQFDISDFKEDALDLPSIAALGYYNVVLVIHSNDRMLLRYGDVNQPIYQKEACALFESGTLASPLTFTYSNITKIDVYPIETKRLEIKNIQFLLEDDFKSCIGLYAQRNNIDVYGINVEEPDNVNKGYSRNFVCLYETYNCELEFQQGNGFDSGGGTYLLRPELTESCKIKNINALNGWGVFGGNYNKNIKFIDCETNRIDQHAIGRDCLMVRCKIYSNMGISLAGKGRLTARDCQHFVRANGANFITLRPDYASYWNGPIVVESLEVVIDCISTDEFNYSIVDANIDTADYGIDHILGTSVVVDGVTVKTDGSFTTLVTVYNAPNNVGVNNQYLPTLISAKNMSSEQSNVRFRVLPTIVADQPKYKGGATTIIAEGIINDHAWVHSYKFNVERDALVRMVGANYATGQPHEFICHVRNCPNSSYVWTLPSELRINGASKVAALLTDAGNGSGTSFPGVENAIHVSDSSIELMNYRGSQDFMLESVNMRSVRVIKPSYNSEVGYYRSLDLSKVESALGVVFDTDVPVIDGQETKVQEFFTGFKSSNWR